MVPAASSSPVQNSVVEWITPQEQLRRLIEPITLEIYGSQAKPGVLSVLGLAEMVAQYAVIDNFIHWYIALERLNLLPERVRALPPNIHQTLAEVEGTHSLYLIPRCSIRKLVLGAIKKCSLKHLAEKKSLLNCDEYSGSCFLYEKSGNFHDFEELKDKADQPEWMLIRNHPLPESEGASLQKKINIVEALGNHTISTIRQEASFFVLDMVAKGKDEIRSKGTEETEVRVVTILHPPQDLSNVRVYGLFATSQNWHSLHDFLSSLSRGGPYAPIGIKAVRQLFNDETASSSDVASPSP